MAVLTSCNRLSFGVLAVEQIARQTYPSPLTEVVIIDDSSTDFSAALFRRLQAIPAVHHLQWLQPRNGSSDLSVGRSMYHVVREYVCSTEHCAMEGLSVYIVHLLEHTSIGAKRNVAVRTAQGDVIVQCVP